jgi:hypothetical protein
MAGFDLENFRKDRVYKARFVSIADPDVPTRLDDVRVLFHGPWLIVKDEETGDVGAWPADRVRAISGLSEVEFDVTASIF